MIGALKKIDSHWEGRWEMPSVQGYLAEKSLTLVVLGEVTAVVEDPAWELGGLEAVLLSS